MPAFVVMLPSDCTATYLITCTPSGEMSVTVAPTENAAPLAPAVPSAGPTTDVFDQSSGAAPSAADDLPDSARQAGERDLDYVRRLMREVPDLELLLKEWKMRLHEVSLRELNGAKSYQQFVPRRRGETRGGNGHLVPVAQVERLLSLFDRVESHGEVPPAWYSTVRSPSRQPRLHAA